MQNELNTNKYFKLVCNRYSCSVKSGAGNVYLLKISVEGNLPPSLYAAPVVKNRPRKAHKDP
ncbi:Hypothetical protein FKW44_003601, partial [Caligus rogercresseyi]